MPKLIDLDVLSSTNARLKKYIDDTNENHGGVISRKTYLEFPNIGRENIIYIDETTDEIYRWDDEDVKYYKVGSNIENIEIISGGNASF